MGEPELTVGAGRRSLCGLMWTSSRSEAKSAVVGAFPTLALQVDAERSMLTTDLVDLSLFLRGS